MIIKSLICKTIYFKQSFKIIKDIRANKYAKKDIIKTELNPQEIANIVARIELITEANPFIDQAQGISSDEISLVNLIPIGNGAPIRNPIGAKMRRHDNNLI